MVGLDNSLAYHPFLQTRKAERDALLQRIQQIVEQDERIIAAWLFGSLGRGEADALSDIDIFIVVSDDHIQAVIVERHGFMARLGRLALVQEAPQNAPPDGAYNMALYAGPNGPQQVDFYWQAQSAARIPQQTIVLLDRVGLPHLEDTTTFMSQPVQERTLLKAVSHTVDFFWVMLLITAKYAARSPEEDRMGLLKYVLNSLRQVQEFVGILPSSVSENVLLPSLAEKLKLLRVLAAQMENLMPQVVAAGGTVPAAIVPQAWLYLDFIEAIMANT